MNTNDEDLDLALRGIWTGGHTPEAAHEVIARALADPPASAIVAARCLQLMQDHRAALAPAVQTRIDEFAGVVATRINRVHQIDQIGDSGTEPEALFEILGDAADSVPIEHFDPQALRRSRLHADSRPAAALNLLNSLGWPYLSEPDAAELRTAAEDLLDRANRYQAHALFVEDADHGFVLGLQARRAGTDRPVGFSIADAVMEKQAEAVLTLGLGCGNATWGIEWPWTYGGDSLGLPLYVATQVELGELPGDPLLAATGTIDANGNVRAVDGIPVKIKAAVAAGFRRVLVPLGNADQARSAVGDLDLEIISVERIEQVREQLTRVSGARLVGPDGLLRLIRRLVSLYGLDLIDDHPITNAHRLEVADMSARAYIDVFNGKRGTVRSGGKGSALAAANRLISERLSGWLVVPRSAQTVLIAAESRRERARQRLLDLGAEELAAGQYEQWRVRLSHGASQATVILYTSGKCVVSAGQAPAFDEAVAAVRWAVDGLGGTPTIPADPATPDSCQGTVDAVEPHIGTDEAGKGDYFGPLVSAAVFVDHRTAQELRELGVQDSKRLSDKKIRSLAAHIRERHRGQFAITTINPARYNELYAAMRREGKNLNTLLAWGHTRSIEDLLAKGIEATYALIDQFGDESYIQNALLSQTRNTGLVIRQQPKAESDIAVAAASVLARDAFLAWLDRYRREAGVLLPKGASDQVIEAARRIVAERGQDALHQVAKLAFKTTDKVLRSPRESGPAAPSR